MRVVDEGHAVAYENIILNGHSFADKSMAADFAMFADLGVLLDLHKRAYLRLIADLATIEIDEFGELYVFSQLHIGSDALMLVHSRMIFPLSFRDRSAASSILTTRKPATPSFNGVRSFSMQSTKYLSSTFKASVCSTLGAHTSPER